MLHRFRFAAGRVHYTNRFLQSHAFGAGARRGRLRYREFATDPCATLFGRFRALFSPGVTDNANVNVAVLGRHAIALTEGALPIEFDADTLATVGRFPFADRQRLRRELTTAHPHTDAAPALSDRASVPHERGLINYFTRFGFRSHYEVFALDPSTRARRVLATVAARRPAYMHSFGLTQRYVVLTEFPFVVDPAALLLSGRPFIENYSWQPERGTRFILVDRRGEQPPVIYEGDPMFAFHHVNAYDDGDDVIVDLVGYDDAGIVGALYLDLLRRSGTTFPAGTYRRYRLRRRSGSTNRADEIARGPDTVELPRVHYARVNTRPYRYAYAAAARVPGAFLSGLIKLETNDGSARRWDAEDCYAGEPVFVPRPAGVAEDDGVVLSVVLDTARDQSFLLVLDAQTFEERARAVAPHRIPAGFHGVHLHA